MDIVWLIILSSRYSSKIAKVFGKNTVPVLATLFLLSYAKLIQLIVTALSYTFVEFPYGKKAVWSADGNIEYLENPHLLLFLAAVAILVFLWLPYIYASNAISAMASKIQPVHHYFNLEQNEALPGCTLWPTPGQTSLLVWGAAPDSSGYSSDI